MRPLSLQAASRIAKIAMTSCLAMFALLVAFNNLTDYGSNYQFVRHVLSMDTTFAGNAFISTLDG